MPVYHDNELDELAHKKCDLGARAEIKKHADEVRVVGDTDIIIRTWKEADEAHAISEGYELTFVRIPQALVYFYKPIHEVWPLIDGVQPKTKGKVGNRVLAKMIAKRIKDLLIDIKATNDSEQQAYSYRKNSPHYSGQTLVAPVPYEITGDIDTIAKMELEFDRWAKSGGWNRDRPLRQLRKALLNKPELTDQDVKDGYGMVLAGLVMEE